MFKATIEASEKTMIPTNTHSIREEVFDKARKILNRLALMKALKKSEEGQYYSGKRRTIVYSEKESRFSIYDTNSKEELLRVILGEKPIYEKENLTQEDVTIFEEALRVLSEMTEQSLKRSQEDSLEID